MPRYIDADKLIEFITKGLNNPDKTTGFGYDAIVILTEIEYAPTADVAPKSEVAREILSDLKKQIHDRAIYPGDKDAYSFVNIRVFDSVIASMLREVESGE